MTDEFNIDSFLASITSEPRDAEEVQQYVSEIKQDREKYLAGAVLKLATMMESIGSSDAAVRSEAMSEAIQLFGEDPTLVTLLIDGTVDVMDEPREEVLKSLVGAADPLTGNVPEGFHLAPDLQILLDTDPELQASVASIPEMLRFDAQDRMARVQQGMREYLDQMYPRATISNTWMQIDLATNEPRALINRSKALRSDIDEGTEPKYGQVTSLFADDPAGTYRIQEIREYRGNQQYAVSLRLYDPHSNVLMVEGRSDWHVYAYIDERELEFTEDDVFDDAWAMRGTFSADELDTVRYEVQLA